jgi:hypothetical protein
VEEIPSASQGTIDEYASFPPPNFSLEDSACEAAPVAISVSTVGKGKKGNRLSEKYDKAMATPKPGQKTSLPSSSQFVNLSVLLTKHPPNSMFYVLCLTIA